MAGGKIILTGGKLINNGIIFFLLVTFRSPPDNPIQSERAKRASSSIMECEEFILPDWSPPDDPARPSDDDDDNDDLLMQASVP